MNPGEGPLTGVEIHSIESLRPVLPTTPCELFEGCKDDGGYGVRRFQGRVMGAHRAAWIQEYGPIPEGMTVDHRCFVPACVALDHLRLLTRSQNARLQRSAFKTECKRGHAYTPENTGRTNGIRSVQTRYCRTCANEARRARKQAAA